MDPEPGQDPSIMIEGSRAGSGSVPRTNESGSRRTENI
jgi:hypothetical protein